MNYTLVHRTPLDAALLRRQGAEILPLAEGLVRSTASTSEVVSPAVEAPAPFDDLVASWNAELPKGSSLEMQVRVRRGADWSGWFGLGRAEPGRWTSAERQDGPFGFVDIDTLKLKERAAAFQYRFLLTAEKKPAVIKLAAVTVSDGENSAMSPPSGIAKELSLRARSQMEEQEKYKHDICSPTSLAMLLDFWGERRPTIEIAEKVRDSRTAIFGHWPFNTASAGDLGVEAWVARLGSLAELEQQIADGRPVAVSITFGPGELDGAPLKKTNGHLIVIVGFTEKGAVIALDPAAPRASSARRVYDRAQFQQAWIGRKRGLAYIVSPLKGRRLAVGTPVAELMAKPRQRRKGDLDDEEHVSQLLYGETVLVDRARGDWVHVEAEQQALHEDRWTGYHGWVRAEQLTAALPSAPNVVVRTRQALAQRGQEIIALSVGTRLTRVSESSGIAHVRLLDGSLAEMPSDALYVPPTRVSEESRSQIVKTAELFLGTSYYWGGRSGVQPELSIGVDCSGLVSLAYRVHGVDVPRDSIDQKLKARPIKRAELAPGDLIFLTEPGRPKNISHVMIYTGGDGVIESRKSSGRVLRSSFKERFGIPLTEIESGQEVVDQSFPKPKKRLVYFGSFF